MSETAIKTLKIHDLERMGGSVILLSVIMPYLKTRKYYINAASGEPTEEISISKYSTLKSALKQEELILINVQVNALQNFCYSGFLDDGFR
jgi:hypothetical protein